MLRMYFWLVAINFIQMYYALVKFKMYHVYTKSYTHKYAKIPIYTKIGLAEGSILDGTLKIWKVYYES
jgi:hypothetical protein